MVRESGMGCLSPFVWGGFFEGPEWLPMGWWMGLGQDDRDSSTHQKKSHQSEHSCHGAAADRLHLSPSIIALLVRFLMREYRYRADLACAGRGSASICGADRTASLEASHHSGMSQSSSLGMKTLTVGRFIWIQLGLFE